MASSDDDSDLEPEHTGPIPLEIIRAVQEGDKELVEQWLVDTDAAYVNATLLKCFGGKMIWADVRRAPASHALHIL